MVYRVVTVSSLVVFISVLVALRQFSQNTLVSLSKPHFTN